MNGDLDGLNVTASLRKLGIAPVVDAVSVDRQRGGQALVSLHAKGVAPAMKRSYQCSEHTEWRYALADKVDKMALGEVLRVPRSRGVSRSWFRERGALSSYQIRTLTAGDEVLAIRIR